MDRIITKRIKNKKIIGYIREVESYPPSSCKYNGKYYALFNTDGQLISSDIDYNKLHKILYSL